MGAFLPGACCCREDTLDHVGPLRRFFRLFFRRAAANSRGRLVRCGVFALIRPQVSQFVLLTERLSSLALFARARPGACLQIRHRTAHFKESQPLSLSLLLLARCSKTPLPQQGRRQVYALMDDHRHYTPHTHTHSLFTPQRSAAVGLFTRAHSSLMYSPRGALYFFCRSVACLVANLLLNYESGL